MALERVAVLEEELELSNQEVGGVAEKGRGQVSVEGIHRASKQELSVFWCFGSSRL